MRCIVSPTFEPFFNIAAEEYFFRNADEDIILIYSNNPSVVVGKHQNALAEINPMFVEEKGIVVIRRLSGGGAVYHDRGNLNFSFHSTVNDISKVDYRGFINPVVEVLNEMGIAATINSRNDILVGNFKVSGHAQHVFRNRVMSHGTLLISSDLEYLSASLKKSNGSYDSKAIQSVRSNVGNVSELSSSLITVAEFADNLLGYLQKKLPHARIEGISNTEKGKIDELVVQKYSTWEWNFGYSPPYRFRNKIDARDGTQFTCDLSVEKGIIVSALLEISPVQLQKPDELSRLITGQRHFVDDLRKTFRSNEQLKIPEDFLINLLF